MIDSATSLLDRDAQQLDLLSSTEMPARILERECLHGARTTEHTAVRYKRDHPTEYRWAVSLLFGDSLSISRVSEMLGASRNTVAAIYEREAQAISVEQVKRDAIAEFRMLRRLSRDRLRDYLLHLPDATDLLRREGGVAAIAGLIHKIGIIMGIATDKEQLLSGGATARVEVGRPASDGYGDLLEAARECARKMGLGGEAGAANGAAAGVPGPDLGGGSGAADAEFEMEGAADEVSSVS